MPRFFIDGRWVKTVGQAIDYPVQFMLDVYEFPRADGARDLAGAAARVPGSAGSDVLVRSAASSLVDEVARS